MLRPIALLTLIITALVIGLPLRSSLLSVAEPTVTVIPIPSVATPASPTPGEIVPEGPVAEVIETTDALPNGFALDTTLATFSTRYRTYKRGRSHNVETAAQRLDGTIIPPHGTLSFNTAVGARTRANGFRRALVIDGGQLVQGMGGGVCQVASTLNAAALEGGLDIVDSRPHSRPSNYIRLGLDTAVSYGQIDLEIANPFDFPVQVRAHAADGVVDVELVGQSVSRQVEITRRVLRRRAYSERIIEDATLPVGTRETEQSGIRGAHVQVTRTITDVQTGERSVERRVVRYPATDEVVRVGTGLVRTEVHTEV